MKWLIVEDDDEKYYEVTKLLETFVPAVLPVRCISVNEAQCLLRQRDFMAAIIDMTIPLFTGSGRIRGGLEPLGGEMIIREIVRKNLKMKCGIVSGFEEFSYRGRDVDFDDLLVELIKRYPPVLGGVFYAASKPEFPEQFRDLTQILL
jgi:hypothetical protein